MSIVNKITGFFKKAYSVVSAAFIRVFGSDAAQKFGDGAMAVLKTALGQIAVDAVSLIQTSNPLATPEEKRKAAFDKIMSDAKSEGLVVSSSLINLLIETAIQFIVKKNILPAA